MYQKANIDACESEIGGDEMLKALGGIPLARQPGTFWEYAITVDVLGLLMERVAKKPPTSDMAHFVQKTPQTSFLTCSRA